MTDTTLITLTPLAVALLVLVATGALCYRSETAQKVSDWIDTWDWRTR